jgi:hypothetical protein
MVLAGKIRGLVDAVRHSRLGPLDTADAAAILAAVPTGALVVFDRGLFRLVGVDDCTAA